MKTLQSEAGSYAERVADIVDAAARLTQGDERFALVTSIAIEGGAAREVGSLAIVEPDGTMTGYLSNGCIDRDIQHRALMALRANRKEVVRYGEGSRFLDLKLPCGGALELLIDPASGHDMLLKAKEDFDARRQATLHFSDGGADKKTIALSMNRASGFAWPDAAQSFGPWHILDMQPGMRLP